MTYVLHWVLAGVAGFAGGLTAKTAHIYFSRYTSRRRDQRFLRHVRAYLPENEVIDIVAVGPNDKALVADIERHIRELSKHRQPTV